MDRRQSDGCEWSFSERFAMIWWAYGLRSWRRRAAPGDSLTFTCELGLKPYAISGADGNDLSDRWAEAKLLKARIEALWTSLDHEAFPIRNGQQGCQISL